MAEGQCGAEFHHRRCIGSIAPNGCLRPLARRQRTPGSLGTHGSKSVDSGIGGCDGVGVIGEVDRLGLTLVGKFPPCLCDRLMEGWGEDSRGGSVPVDGVAGAKFGRAFVGPPWGWRVAKVSAVRTAVADGLSLGSGSIAMCLMAQSMGHGYPASLPYTRLRGAGTWLDGPAPVVSPDPTAWPAGRLGILYIRYSLASSSITTCRRGDGRPIWKIKRTRCSAGGSGPTGRDWD